MMFPNVKVTDVAPTAPAHLRVSWTDGVTRDVDLSAWMTTHPLLKMLNDPQVFRDVSVISNGGGIEFGNGVDFCAQALRLLSDEQTLPDTRKSA